MTWVKLDDRFFDHPKVLAAGRDARDLYLVGLLYSSEALLDGCIPAEAISLLAFKAGVRNAPALVQKLVDVGLWERGATCYKIHDYLDYNPPAERVREKRREAAQRMQKNRSARAVFAVSSPDVRANIERSSSEVRGAFANSSPYPVPVPVPVLEPDTEREEKKGLRGSDAPESSPFFSQLSFKVYQDRLKAGEGLTVVTEAFETVYGVKGNEHRLNRMMQHAGKGELLKLIFASAPTWNQVDDPMNYLAGAVKRHKAREGTQAGGRAVDRSSLVANDDYTFLLEANQNGRKG